MLTVSSNQSFYGSSTKKGILPLRLTWKSKLPEDFRTFFVVLLFFTFLFPFYLAGMKYMWLILWSQLKHPKTFLYSFFSEFCFVFPFHFLDHQLKSIPETNRR